MTAPTRPQALAPASVAVQMFKAEAAVLDAAYRRHVHVCWAVEHGLWCRACTVLIRAADTAGKQVMVAEAREARW